MELQKRIMSDYIDAKENGQRLLRFALEDLQPLDKRKLNQNEFLNSIEDLIDKMGYSIMKKARKRKNIETDVFKMVLLNNYICEFRFQNKTRKILLQYRKDDEMNENWNSQKEVPPKVIIRNKGLLGFLR